MRIALLAMILLVLTGCSTNTPVQNQVPQTNNAPTTVHAAQPTTLKELPPAEVREYKGKRLDSITDVRDVSIKGPQQVDINTYKLEVTGLEVQPKTYTYDDILALQHYTKEVTLHCTEGWTADVLWEGVLLNDLIGDVKPEANTLIFYSVDGYTTSLPLNYVTSNNIMLAYKINNITLTPDTGYPFMVVAEDKLGYKWAKWVTKIEVSSDSNYQGYWESRGYPNDAKLS